MLGHRVLPLNLQAIIFDRALETTSPRDHVSSAGEGARRTIRPEQPNSRSLGGTLLDNLSALMAVEVRLGKPGS